MNKNKGFTVVELITSFTLASVIMIILFNIILILKDYLSEVNAKTNMLVEKDNLSYNINKRFKEKEISSITTCGEGDKCYLFTYSDDTSDKLIYNNADKTITFNNYTFDIIDGITVEEPTITEHYDTMSSTTYNGYFIIHIPIKIDDKDYSIKINKHFNTDSLVIDVPEEVRGKNGNLYTIVEYLESTGTQYIDTMYNPNQDTSIKAKIVFPLIISKSNNSVFGSRKAYNDSHYGLTIGNNNKFWDGYNNISFDTSKTVYTSIEYNIYKNKNKLFINDELIKEHDYDEFISSYYLYIFGMNQNNTVNFQSRIKLYNFEIYDNDTLVRDYIPVIDSSERPCLFDKVEKKCYYNQGTGEFLYG